MKILFNIKRVAEGVEHERQRHARLKIVAGFMVTMKL